jgi:hypothetical protein
MLVGLFLPYVRTPLSGAIRMYMLFPILCGSLCYVLFLKRYRQSGGETAYKYRLRSLPSIASRIVVTTALVVGAIGFPAFIAFSSYAISACLTTLGAQNEVVKSVRISAVVGRGGYGQRSRQELTLEESDGSWGKVIVRRTMIHNSMLSVGENVCVRGREWRLGTIVDAVSKSNGSC